ncbi:LacI family DNA-binding transcriptional regulator, partial [Salmonella enterica subsp. enterica serovar Kentucky]|nr:LacI family DNA-binding transcriptional regulator [Salmonella enterica subsp. enterica serovar Kentucky]ECS4629361.1 LacI family DNA-binding transcriptional regulator [Salmonella enterica subsp. enterica serovar Kentucky]HDV8591980.1 LacI family DNA-binding transcriptional regulator [Escherichia coli]
MKDVARLAGVSTST